MTAMATLPALPCAVATTRLTHFEMRASTFGIVDAVLVGRVRLKLSLSRCLQESTDSKLRHTFGVVDEILHGDVCAILLEAPLRDRLPRLNVHLQSTQNASRAKLKVWRWSLKADGYKMSKIVNTTDRHADCGFRPRRWAYLEQVAAALRLEHVHLPLAVHQQQLRGRQPRAA